MRGQVRDAPRVAESCSTHGHGVDSSQFSREDRHALQWSCALAGPGKPAGRRKIVGSSQCRAAHSPEGGARVRRVQAAPVIMSSFFSCLRILSRLTRVMRPINAAPPKAAVAAVVMADTDSTTPTLVSVDATIAVVTAFWDACMPSPSHRHISLATVTLCKRDCRTDRLTGRSCTVYRTCSPATPLFHPSSTASLPRDQFQCVIQRQSRGRVPARGQGHAPPPGRGRAASGPRSPASSWFPPRPAAGPTSMMVNFNQSEVHTHKGERGGDTASANDWQTGAPAAMRACLIARSFG